MFIGRYVKLLLSVTPSLFFKSDDSFMCIRCYDVADESQCYQ